MDGESDSLRGAVMRYPANMNLQQEIDKLKEQFPEVPANLSTELQILQLRKLERIAAQLEPLTLPPSSEVLNEILKELRMIWDKLDRIEGALKGKENADRAGSPEI